MGEFSATQVKRATAWDLVRDAARTARLGSGDTADWIFIEKTLEQAQVLRDQEQLEERKRQEKLRDEGMAEVNQQLQILFSVEGVLGSSVEKLHTAFARVLGIHTHNLIANAETQKAAQAGVLVGD